MLRPAAFVLSACLIAWSGDCPPKSPISLHSDHNLDLTIFFDNTPAASTPLQVYSDDKLVRSVLTDHDGRARFGLLSAGKYRVVVPSNETLDVVVLPQKSGINGPMVSWYLFPKSKYKWVEGKKVVGKPCPILMIQAN